MSFGAKAVRLMQEATAGRATIVDFHPNLRTLEIEMDNDSVTFEMLARLAKALGTRKINICGRNGTYYSEETGSGPATVTIEISEIPEELLGRDAAEVKR